LTKDMIKRINELARKKNKEGLTPEELSEQQELYSVYLKGIREQVRAQLDPNYSHSSDKEGDYCPDHQHNEKRRH
jgi:uncharacterized protein YnzC (UPF0291/DUF896 family)